MGDHEVNVGARVRSRDGKKLGVIKQLIVHPETFRVDGFILGSGILSDEKIVPADLVTATDKSGVVLAIDKANVADLPTVIHEQLLKASGPVSFGAGVSQVDMYGAGNQQFLRGPSGGQLPHTGAESFFMQAPIGNIVTENVSNLSANHVAISEGTEVIGSDGEKVGNVDEIFVEKRIITGVLVRAGRLLHHDVRIPRSKIAGLSHQRIRLTVTAEDAEHASKRDE
jgi:uncharacterized protein YrrD